MNHLDGQEACLENPRHSFYAQNAGFEARIQMPETIALPNTARFTVQRLRTSLVPSDSDYPGKFKVAANETEQKHGPLLTGLVRTVLQCMYTLFFDYSNDIVPGAQLVSNRQLK